LSRVSTGFVILSEAKDLLLETGKRQILRFAQDDNECAQDDNECAQDDNDDGGGI
jgi:hypothetical protein